MLITNFAAGELSPTLSGRVDIAQYFQGAASLKNFDIIPTGGIRRRYGTEFVADLSAPCRLIPFIIDKDLSYIIELKPNSIRIWNDDQECTVESSGSSALFIPWASLSEIREVQYAQNYDTMIFCQKDYAPQVLKHNGAGIFSFGPITFDFSPDVNLDDDYDWITVIGTGEVKPSGSTTSGYCIDGGYLWKWDGTQWVKDDSVTEYELSDDLFTSAGNYPACCAFFNSRLFFASTANDRQKVWASAAPDESGMRYNEFAIYAKYVTVNKVVKDPDVHYFTADTEATATTTTETDEEGNSTTETTWDQEVGSRNMLVNVTQDLTFINSAEEDYYVTSDVTSIGTKIVSATWNSSTNKGTVTLDSDVLDSGEALVFSIQKWVQRDNASSDDYEYTVVQNNMTRASDAFYFEVASDQNDAIKWLATSTHLVIGTESSCFVMASTSTATGQTVVMNGRHGTDDLQATVVDHAIIYFAQGKRGIREFKWDTDEEVFKSNDLTIFCPEVLAESAACDFDFMTNPYARLMVTREDGTMAVMLYEKTSGVMAWSRLIHGKGEIISCAVVRGDGASDIAYLCVRYEDSGNYTYTLEKLDFMPQAHSISQPEVYLDAHRTFEGDTSSLEGDMTIYNETTGECATVSEYNAMTAKEKAAFYASGNTAYAGYTYESYMKSMPVNDGDTSGKKRIVKLFVRFYKSYKPRLQVEGRQEELFSDFSEPYSGIKLIPYPGTSERDVSFSLITERPLPCTILAVEAILTQ